MKKVISAVAVVGLLMVPSLAWGQVNINKNKATQNAGNVITNGSPSSSSSSSAVQSQGQTQGQQQKQGQAQGQKQGQKIDDSANNEGNNQSVRTSFDRYAPSIAAPALTSGGIGVCLGSFSAGLTGPMAGIAFGKTTQDEGCARARDSMILFNMGFKSAGLRVLSGASIKEALEAEGLMPLVSSKAVSTAPTPVTVGAEQIFSEVGPSAAQLVQGN